MDDLEEDYEDDFEKTYKGEISKSGTAVLPSKRIRRVVDKTVQQPKTLAAEDNISENSEVEKESSPEDNKPEDSKSE